MGIPQVGAQVRRAPVLALRAVFAGIGRILMAADRPEAAVPAQQPSPRFRSLVETGNVRLLSPQEALSPLGAPSPDEAASTEKPPPTKEALSAQEPVDEGARSGASAPALARHGDGALTLPLPSYDSLSLASIRARLRGLDVGQVKVLLDYEAVNAERPEVLGMFERRIEKLESGG